MFKTWINSKKTELKKLSKSKCFKTTKKSNVPGSDLYAAIFPIYHLCKFCGILPVNFVQKGTQKYVGRTSFWNVGYGVLLVFLFFAAQTWGLWRDLKQGWQNSTRLSSQTAITVTCCDVCAVFILVVSVIIGAPFRWKYWQIAMDKLVEVDETLGIQSAKRLRRLTIVITLLTLTYIITISCMDYTTWKYANSIKRPNASSDEGPINYSPIYAMYVVITVFEIQYCVCMYNVGVRFERLNKTIEKQSQSKEVINYFIKDLGLGNHFKRNEQIVAFIKSDMGYGHNPKPNNSVWPITENYEIQQNVVATISRMITLHSHLCDTVILLNNSFGISIICAIVSCLIHLIITPYFLYMEINDEAYLWQMIVTQSLWCFYHIIRLLLIVQPCHLAAYEASKTGVIISQLLSSNWGPRVQNQLEIFSLQLILRPIDFNAYGLFTINRSLLASIAGAVTTYLVILIQFQTSDDEKGTKNMLKNVTDFLHKNTTIMRNVTVLKTV